MTLEKIVRPIIEGKLRQFVQEHPSLLDCVVWYKKGGDKEDTFVNSAAKRIVHDLISQETSERLRTVLCGANPHREGSVVSSAAAHHSVAGGVREGETTSLPHITAADVAGMLDAAGLRVHKNINKTTNLGKTSELLLADQINDLIERKVKRRAS